MTIIHIDGIDYEVNGDYPNGKYSRRKVPVDVPVDNTTLYSKDDFIRLIPQGIRTQLFELGKTNEIIRTFIEMLKLVNKFKNDEDWFVEGIAELVSLDIINQTAASVYLPS